MDKDDASLHTSSLVSRLSESLQNECADLIPNQILGGPKVQFCLMALCIFGTPVADDWSQRFSLQLVAGA